MSYSPSLRQPVAVAATAIVVVTFFTLVFVFDTADCFFYGSPNRVLALFLVPAVLFSLGVVVLIFFPMLWLLSLVIKASKASIVARPLALSLAVGAHFLIGAIGWAVFRDLPGVSSDYTGLAWIPFWIVGALHKLEVIGECM